MLKNKGKPIDISTGMLYNNHRAGRYAALPTKIISGEGKVTMKAVITVTGKDSVGIIAKISAECAKYDANIVDISQSVLSEYFAMIMLADIDNLKVPFSDFVDLLSATGKDKGLSINVMHEDIFNTMHHI